MNVFLQFKYCDSMFGPSLDALDRNIIQKVQNACCCFIFALRHVRYVSHSARSLDWLRMESWWILHLGCSTNTPVTPKVNLFAASVYILGIHTNQNFYCRFVRRPCLLGHLHIMHMNIPPCIRNVYIDTKTKGFSHISYFNTTAITFFKHKLGNTTQ